MTEHPFEITGDDEFPFIVKDWDESLHPREPGGSSIGGQFASGGGGEKPFTVSGPGLNAPSSAYPPRQPNAPTSQQRFSDKTGWSEEQTQYTPERAALHDDIIEHFTKGITPVDEPVAYWMGGGPASGKSTILKTGDVVLPTNAVSVNSDEVKKMLPEFGEMKAAGDANAANFVHDESSELGTQITGHAAHNGMNVVVDGTGDHSYEDLAQRVNYLKTNGMRVEANYVTVDTDEAVKRSTARATKPGEDFGRHVPEAYVRNVHSNISAILPEAMRQGLFDKVTLWDNNGSKPIKVASAEGTNITIHDPAAYERFKAKARK